MNSRLSIYIAAVMLSCLARGAHSNPEEFRYHEEPVTEFQMLDRIERSEPRPSVKTESATPKPEPRIPENLSPMREKVAKAVLHGLDLGLEPNLQNASIVAVNEIPAGDSRTKLFDVMLGLPRTDKPGSNVVAVATVFQERELEFSIKGFRVIKNAPSPSNHAVDGSSTRIADRRQP